MCANACLRDLCAPRSGLPLLPPLLVVSVLEPAFLGLLGFLKQLGLPA